MFKKSLLAVALGLSAFGANAATNVIATPSVISIEGTVGQTDVTAATSVVTLGAEYAVGDTITFTLSGAEFDTATSAGALALAPAAGTATAGLLTTTASTVTFRVTGATGATFTAGTATLTGMKLKTTSLTAAGTAKLAYSASTSTGLALDTTGTLSATLATKVAQFSSSATVDADGIIDVEEGRKQFTVGPLTDTIEITPVEAVAATNDAAYTGATHVIKGDFSWMESDGDAGIDAAELAAAFAATGGADTYTSTINAAADAITVTVADAAGNTVEVMTATFTVLGSGNAKAPILPSQKFTVDSTIKYNTAASAPASKLTQSAEAAGEWKLNGFDETIVFMPFGPEYAQSINVSNTKSVEGAITVDITSGGNTYTKTLTAVATAKATTNITAEVKAFAAESGVTGNANIKVVVNSPVNDIAVTGVYYHKADGDRVKTK